MYVCVESKNNLVISSKAVTLVFETGSPSGLELTKEARPCTQQASGIYLLLSSTSLAPGTQMHATMPAFCFV